jgi:hypothetical protein
MTSENRFTNVTQHIVIPNTPLSTSDKNGCTFIGDVTAAVFKAFKANAIEYGLQISDLLRRQLCADTFKSHIRQDLSSQDMPNADVHFTERLSSTPHRIRCRI